MGQNVDLSGLQVIDPSTSPTSQICTLDSSPLRFRIGNSGTASYTVSVAQSIIVTLTLSGNTFSPSGLTTKVHTFTAAPDVQSGPPTDANTLNALTGFAFFDWPASKDIIFTNPALSTINIEVATGVASDTTPANNTVDYVIDIIADPITPVLSAGSYGDGTINVCQGDLVTFTVLPSTALTHRFEIAGVEIQNLAKNTLETSGLVSNTNITVTSFNTANCGTVGNTIKAMVHTVPTGTMYSDKSNNIVCPGEDVIFTALAFTDGNIGEFQIAKEYIPIFQTLLVTVYGAYFVGRTWEKQQT